MKKLFALLFVAGTMSIVACGPSAEEKAKMEADAKKAMDSLFNTATSGMEKAMEEATTAVDTAAAAATDAAATATEGAATTH